MFDRPPTGLVGRRSLHVAALVMSAMLPHHARPQAHQDLRIRVLDFRRVSLQVSGDILACTGEDGMPARPLLHLPEGSRYRFWRNGRRLELAAGDAVELPCDEGDRGAPVSFLGWSPGHPRKCEARGGELYCLNHSAPNPELLGVPSSYGIRFLAPEGYRGLTPDADLVLPDGLAFHLARLAPRVLRFSESFEVSYHFPEGFTALPEYMDFLEATLDSYRARFGPLPFVGVKVGAIRRGEESGAISGSPAGNLILFSRTALRDPPDLSGLAALGVKGNATDAFRKLVIAHELSHFWFGGIFQGQDGWMVEGIPNYLALIRVSDESRASAEQVLTLWRAQDARGPEGPIPGHPYGDGADQLRAYYQGALALWALGEELGHDELSDLLAEVFRIVPSPAFEDVEAAFLTWFPEELPLWRRAWRLDAAVVEPGEVADGNEADSDAEDGEPPPGASAPPATVRGAAPTGSPGDGPARPRWRD